MATSVGLTTFFRYVSTATLSNFQNKTIYYTLNTFVYHFKMLAVISILSIYLLNHAVCQSLTTSQPSPPMNSINTAPIPGSSLQFAPSIPLQQQTFRPSNLPGNSVQLGTNEIVSLNRPSSPLASLSDETGLSSLLQTATNAIQSASRNGPPPSPQNTQMIPSNSGSAMMNNPQPTTVPNEPLVPISNQLLTTPIQQTNPNPFYTNQVGEAIPLSTSHIQPNPVRYTRQIGGLNQHQTQMSSPIQMSASPNMNLPPSNPSINSNSSVFQNSMAPVPTESPTHSESSMRSGSSMNDPQSNRAVNLMNPMQSDQLSNALLSNTISNPNANINVNVPSEFPSNVANLQNQSPNGGSPNLPTALQSFSSPTTNDELTVQYDGMQSPVSLGINRIPHFESSDPALRAAFAQSRGYSLLIHNPDTDGLRSTPYPQPQIPPPQPITEETRNVLNQQRQEITNAMANVTRLPTQQITQIRTNLNNQQ